MSSWNTFALGLSVAWFGCGCALSSHPVVPSTLGTPSSSEAMLRTIDEPGPVKLETVNSADWAVSRSGLIHLSDPRAKAAGLQDDLEPIHIYFHVLTHPTRGLYLVDTGAERALRDDPSRAAIRGLLAQYLHTDRLAVKNALGDFLAARQERLAGVFLTHLHADHVSGMPDVPRGTPIYAGPGETRETELQNLVVAPNIDRALQGQAPISEWGFEPDPSGRFAGVLDVFDDQTVWAILAPGHTPGSTAFVVRTPEGPVLLTGDVSHTGWGWEHAVPPGSFTLDHAKNQESLDKLRALKAEHPNLEVRLGHQGADKCASCARNATRAEERSLRPAATGSRVLGEVAFGAATGRP